MVYLAILVAISLAFGVRVLAAEQFSIATGGTAGTYYPIGSAIASVVSKYVPGVKMNAEATGASVANLRMLKAKKVDFIMAASNTAYGAYSGEPPFDKDPVKNLRGIAALYPEVFQFVVRKDSGIKSFYDLRGKKVAVGAPGSGTERTAKLVLAAHGLTYGDIKPQFLSFAEAMTALKDRVVDCAIVGAGVPTPAVIDAAMLIDINLLSVDEKVIGDFLKKHPYLALFEIAPGTYKGVDQSVITVSSPALLCVDEGLSEEVVYKIVKAIFDHIDEIAASHAQAKNIKLETALKGMSIPLHPGAERFFREKGLIR